MEVYHVPCNLYGLAVVEPLQLDRHIDGFVIYFMELSRLVFLLCLNYATQLAFIRRIAQIIQGDSEQQAYEYQFWGRADCSDETYKLQLICVFVFCVTTFAELRETCDLANALYHCPVKGYKWIPSLDAGRAFGAVGKQGVLEVDAAEDSAAKGGVANVLHAAFGAVGEEDKLEEKEANNWNFRAMTKRYKVAIMICIVIPKLIIGLLLTYIGAAYILHSDDPETLILNTMAVNFVLDIDEYFYSSFTSNSVRNRLAECHEIVLNFSNWERLASFLFLDLLLPSCLAIVTYTLVSYNRSHC
eukprot:gnl/MRDRNA2_/MRDRNA2_19811_c0_seq1.p1 gnl/MRDRNA2_/MRDRNA2_19811_c0~~gnl/MRDRNA2_/MRDRNA2_19811_c0_seq1.p1  ORF type:complete len:301 (-),score=37.16 gnl/MRDRNA2_/MRDRNA2_19811_c0_seq1:79-981(-)